MGAVTGQGHDFQRLIFELARHLKAVAGHDPSDEAPVLDFCRRMRLPPDGVMFAFAEAWEKVERPAVHILGTAAALARLHPVVIPGIAADLLPGASYCYHMQALSSPEPFELSYENMGRFQVGGDPDDPLNAQRWKTIGRGIINRLLKDGVICCVDATYSKRNKQARKYRIGVG